MHSVRTQFDPVPQPFGERTVNEFGVNEALAITRGLRWMDGRMEANECMSE